MFICYCKSDLVEKSEILPPTKFISFWLLPVERGTATIFTKKGEGGIQFNVRYPYLGLLGCAAFIHSDVWLQVWGLSDPWQISVRL